MTSITIKNKKTGKVTSGQTTTKDGSQVAINLKASTPRLVSQLQKAVDASKKKKKK